MNCWVVVLMASAPPGIRRRVSRSGEVRWQVRFQVRDATSPTGWVETSKTFPTLASAKAFKAERDHEAAVGQNRFDPRAGRVPLSKVWDQYVGLKKPALSAKTWSGYQQAWKLRINPTFGTTPVGEIKRDAIAAWVKDLTVGPWAKKSTLRLLRSILAIAVEDGRIRANPAGSVSAPPIPPRDRHRYLTAGEVEALAAACGDQGDVVQILAYTGLRWSELVALRVMDVDLNRGRIHVWRSAPEVEGVIVIGRVKTKASKRTVPIPARAAAVLKARIDGRPLDDPAVASPEGAMLRANNWRRHTHWKKALKDLGVAPLKIHDLRHTYASLARSGGADLRWLQKTRGHSSVTVTAGIYADLYDYELDEVANVLDRVIETGHEPDKKNSTGPEAS